MNDRPIIGTTDTGDMTVDVDRLIGSHLCVVANAGGGKSGKIRKLLEATHGLVQHIVIDIEDEFYTLRQNYDYVIAGGDDGDCPAKVENAAGLARAALTHGFSLIAQINDLGTADAGDFLHEFLESMLTAPRDLWRPCLIVIDEAQRYDQSIIQMLTERGRKRGFTAVLASQRLPKIDANVRGDINNWIMGRVGQSLDRRIMADQLGFTPKEATEKLQRIKPRHFWGFGPALADEPVLFRVGDVETTMVKPGQAKVMTPPPPEAMREILAGLAVEPLRTEASNEGQNLKETDEALKAKDNQIERLNKDIGELTVDRNHWRETAEIRGALIERARSALQSDVELENKVLNQSNAKAGDEARGKGNIEVPQAEPVSRPVAGRSATATSEIMDVTAGETTLSPGEKVILTAACQYPQINRDQLSVLTGYKRSSRNTYITRLKSKGLVSINGSSINPTDDALRALGGDYQPLPTGHELQSYWLDRLSPGENAILKVLIRAYPKSIARADLDDLTKYKRSSRNTYITRLKSRRLVDVEGASLSASATLFGESQ